MPKRGKINLVACEPCRRRKVKCDGDRPDCGACKRAVRRCDYASQAGLTRTAALKYKISQLRTDNESLLNLYSRLRDERTPEAQNLLERIRSGAQPLAVPSLSRATTVSAIPNCMEHQEPGAREYNDRRTSTNDSNSTDLQTRSSATQASVFCKGSTPAELDEICIAEGINVLGARNALLCVSEHESAHAIIADIATLKSTACQMLRLCSDSLSLLSAIRQAQDQLSAWYERLPDERLLLMLGTDVQLPLKISLYYVHLLHLGAVMLIFRYCLAGFRSSKGYQIESREQDGLLDEALGDGFLAAQQSVRMICLMRQAPKSVRNCPVTIRQSYISGMILAYQTTKLVLAGDRQGRWLIAFDLLGKIIDALESCQDNAFLALEFAQMLSKHYFCLRKEAEEFPSDRGPSHLSSEADDAGSWAPNPGTYLFTTPTEASQLHQLSDGLLSQLCDL